MLPSAREEKEARMCMHTNFHGIIKKLATLVVSEERNGEPGGHGKRETYFALCMFRTF